MYCFSISIKTATTIKYTCMRLCYNLPNKCSTKSNSAMVMKGHYEFTFTIIRLY